MEKTLDPKIINVRELTTPDAVALAALDYYGLNALYCVGVSGLQLPAGAAEQRAEQDIQEWRTPTRSFLGAFHNGSQVELLAALQFIILRRDRVECELYVSSKEADAPKLGEAVTALLKYNTGVGHLPDTGKNIIQVKTFMGMGSSDPSPKCYMKALAALTQAGYLPVERRGDSLTLEKNSVV